MKNKLFGFFILIISLLSFCNLAYTRLTQLEIKFRLAQSYERDGDYEMALKLYQEIYQKDSTNIIVFDALRRIYTQMKRYDDAIILVNKKLQSNPSDINLLVQLGTLYLRNSEESKATDTWSRAIALSPKNEMSYRIVAQAMIENRILDRAIATYRQGRIACGDANLFTVELASLYSSLMNYSEATREYLNLIRSTPNQLGYIQSRMASYIQRADGLNAAILVIEQARDEEPTNITIHQLLAWLYMEKKDFDKAFSIYKFIDQKNQASGMEIFMFAERALNEKAYDAALKAYRTLMNDYAAFSRMPQVKFGYARTLEEMSTLVDTLHLFGNVNPFAKNNHSISESTHLLINTIAAYQQLIKEYPNSEVAAEGLFRIAVLNYERLFNIDEAITNLENLQKSYGNIHHLVNKGLTLQGEILIVAGNLAKAESVLQSVIKRQPTNKNIKDRAAFLLAEISFFNGNINEAHEQLKELTKMVTSDIANDALWLQYFIEENLKPSDEALKSYAKAALLKRQHKFSQAMLEFENIARTFKSYSLIDQTLMTIGDILTHMQRYNDAINIYEQTIKDYPESILSDRIIMKIGEIYHYGTREQQKAILTYQLLLERFPKSIFANEARKRIRELRGENI